MCQSHASELINNVNVFCMFHSIFLLCICYDAKKSLNKTKEESLVYKQTDTFTQRPVWTTESHFQRVL